VDISEASTFRHGILILCVSSLILVIALAYVGPLSVNRNIMEDPNPSVVYPTHKSLVPKTPNRLPIAVVTPSFANVLVDERLVLSAEESTDPDGSIVNYRWVFGPRGVVFGSQLTLKFAEPGLETVKLIVEDDEGGISSAEASIEVIPRISEAVLILSAGPNNMLNLEAGAQGTVVMEIAAYNQPVSNIEVEVIDDGGLDVSIGNVPQELEPGEHVELLVKISAHDVGVDSTGSIVLLRAMSEQGGSDAERIEVMVRSAPTHASLNEEFIEFLVLILGFSILLLVIGLWKKR
jgi:hypothetical protein